MGNAPLTIGVKVDNEKNGGFIVAGSSLYGRIYLSNNQGGTVNARSIRLKLIGTEEAVVHHTSSDTTGNRNNNANVNVNVNVGTTTNDHYERSSDIIYSIDHTIKEFPGGVIPKGQFEFPFALQLPTSLPSSMRARNSESTCEVRYEVVAEVFQKPNTLFYSNPHAKEQLTVVAMPRTVAGSPIHLPVEIIPISNCCCCSCFSCTRVGTMALEAKFDKSTLLLDSPSSPAHSNLNSNSSWSGNARPITESNGHQKSFGVAFRCQNKSTARVKSVKAELTETIEWHVHGHKETIRTVLAATTVDALLVPELDNLRYAPFYWQQHQYGSRGRRQSDSETNLLLGDKPWRTIHPALGVEAARATDSYRGKAVQVRHVLGVTVVTEGCCSTNPDASTIVELYRNPVAFGGREPSASAAHDPLEFHHAHTPSAPFEDEPTAFSAPFDQKTKTKPHATAPSSLYDGASEAQVPMAEAQLVLPENWNAQTAELVTIPIAEAMVLDDNFQANANASSGNAK